jgi:hypothetical protein
MKTETITLEAIDGLALAYSDRRAVLLGLLHGLDRELAALKKKHLPALKRQVAAAAECEHELRAAIEAAPELFDKPKTQVLHGIKVGYRKGKGTIEWEDDAALVALIKKKFPDHVGELIITTEVPSATGLQDLDAAELRKLGVTIAEAGEQVVVKAVETDLEKLVKALLKDAREEAE